jgi:peptidyl-prolyl cis-trans isomerase SurA
MGRRGMRFGLVLLTAAATHVAVAGAQQPAAPAAPPPSTQARDSIIPLDRIIAVVGDQVITQFDLQERMLALQQSPNFRPPQTEADYNKLAREIINALIDEEALIHKANELKVEIPDADLTPTIDRQMREIRGRFPTEQEFRAELAKAGLGTPEDYRRFLTEQMRRTELQRRVVAKLRQEGKLPPVNVSQAEVEAAFNRERSRLPRRPATVTFRQLVVAPKPTAAARATARARAESILVEIKGGGDFERIARRESADSASRIQGGDLGWNRRGQMVPEFEQWMFGLRPGDLSPVVETGHGFHIIRVDRVQPGEVKSRHILIEPVVDSADHQRARAEADSAARRWRAGVPFDTLVKAHHDKLEETSILTPITRDSLPASYLGAFANKKAGDIMVFEIPGMKGHPKYVVAQLLSADEGGEYTLADLKDRVRQQLVDEGSYRRMLDNLRKELYVSIRLDDSPRPPATTPPPDR